MKPLLLLFASSAFIVLQSFGQYESRFSDGYYYDSSGRKVEGLLKLRNVAGTFSNKSNGDLVLLFKSKKGESKEKFTPNEVQHFVIGTDSFTVIKKFSIHYGFVYPKDFARVMLSGRINLYEYYARFMGGSGMTSATFQLVKKEGKIVVIDRKKHLKKILAEYYYSDYPELEELFKGKKMNSENIYAATEQYNAHFAIQQ